MFNNFYLQSGDTKNNASVIMNQPSTGMIQKSNPLSRFIKVKKDSKEFNTIFPTDFQTNPCLRSEVVERLKTDDHEHFGPRPFYKKTIEKEIIVLQCMVFGHDEFLVEYVFKDELETEEK